MGKLIGILLGVVALWVGMEVYLKGVDGALGGAFAASGVEATRLPSVPLRAGAAVESAHADADARREALLGE